MLDFIKKISQLTLSDLLGTSGITFAISCYAISIASFSINEIVHLLTVLTVVGLGLNAILYSRKTIQTTLLLRKSF